MTLTERFSTVGLSPSERAAHWRQVGGETYSVAVFEPQSWPSFQAALTRRAYGAVSLSRTLTTPATVRSDWSGPSARPEHALLLLQERGATDHKQDGKRVRLEGGELTLLALSRPYSVVFSQVSELVILKLPYDRIVARIGDPAPHLAMHVGAQQGALLSNFLRTLAGQMDGDHDDEWDEAACDVIFDHIALTYRQRPQEHTLQTELGTRWQRTVHDFVDGHLSDPELGAALIARRLGVTPRYVQMVFAGMGTTASACILARRLELAAQLLSDASRTVADVAFQVGFSDLSYFYRGFRRRFGVPPGRYRKRTGAGAASRTAAPTSPWSKTAPRLGG